MRKSSIVDYIVKNTVGKLLQELSPRKIKKLRILDPACGSGSFLIRAYEEMMSYYQSQKKQQRKTTKGQQKLDLRHVEEEPRLTIQEKSKILHDHIFGVDIDEQAIEVTKLSLMLKMLEGEYGFVPGRAILPMLNKNIRCGNSLISGDTLELKKYFGDDWYKVKPLNWAEEFKEIMAKEGGFGVVIGNPPYVLGRETFDKKMKAYLSERYAAFVGKYDLYIYFTEKAISLTRQGGRVGYILPNTILTNENATILRKIILDRTSLEVIRVFKTRVFKRTQVESVILITINKRADRKNTVLIETEKLSRIPQSIYRKSEKYRFNVYSDSQTEKLIEKIQLVSVPLGILSDICIGIQLGGSSGSDTKERFLSKTPKDTSHKKVLDGRDINCYRKSGMEYLFVMVIGFTERGTKNTS